MHTIKFNNIIITLIHYITNIQHLKPIIVMPWNGIQETNEHH